MHIQISEAMFAALTASQLGYVMKQRGEVEIKVRSVYSRLGLFLEVAVVQHDSLLIQGPLYVLSLGQGV